MKKLILSVFSTTCLLTGVAHAAEPKVVLSVGYLDISGDVELSSGTADFDGDATALNGRFYVSDNLALSAGIREDSGELTLNGTKIEPENEEIEFGVQYVFGGRVDNFLGEGVEHRAGLLFQDAEQTSTNPTPSQNYTGIHYAYSKGFGNGVVGTIDAVVDSEDFLDHRDISFELSKNLTKTVGVFVGGFNIKQPSVDENSESSVSGFQFGLMVTL